MPSNMTPFWLDANVYIEAKNRYYTFDRVPKFWSFLSAQIQLGSVCSPKAVYDELMPYGDQLTTWVKSRKKKGLCVQPNEGTQRQFTKIADFVDTEFQRHKSEEFLKCADPWVIACALHAGGTVVTQESTSRRQKV